MPSPPQEITTQATWLQVTPGVRSVFFASEFVIEAFRDDLPGKARKKQDVQPASQINRDPCLSLMVN
jgi:hypothetical protein